MGRACTALGNALIIAFNILIIKGLLDFIFLLLIPKSGKLVLVWGIFIYADA